MKFGELFNHHKIPEWFNDYINYNLLQNKLNTFQKCIKQKKADKLQGYYTITKDGKLVKLDIKLGAGEGVDLFRTTVRELTKSEKTDIMREESVFSEAISSGRKFKIESDEVQDPQGREIPLLVLKYDEPSTNERRRKGSDVDSSSVSSSDESADEANKTVGPEGVPKWKAVFSDRTEKKEKGGAVTAPAAPSDVSPQKP